MEKASIGLLSAVYLTNDEAAALLRLSPRTLEKHRFYGRGPRFHKFGRRVFYASTDVAAWIASGARDETCGR